MVKPFSAEQSAYDFPTATDKDRQTEQTFSRRRFPKDSATELF
jgi:hypothetical protein